MAMTRAHEILLLHVGREKNPGSRERVCLQSSCKTPSVGVGGFRRQTKKENWGRPPVRYRYESHSSSTRRIVSQIKQRTKGVAASEEIVSCHIRSPYLTGLSEGELVKKLHDAGSEHVPLTAKSFGARNNGRILPNSNS